MSYIIPTKEKVFSQTNKSDVGGNIWCTKNINFDEKGYIKLSPRAVSLQSEKNDSDFDVPVYYGRTATGSFTTITTDTPWIISADSSTGIISQQDTDSGVVGGTFVTYGKWWQNRLYQTIDTAMRYKTGSTWTNPGVGLTTGKAHPVEVFANRNTLVIGDGNTVKQINTSHSVSTLAQLTIPADYEVVGLSYSSNKMGVITKLSNTASGQNKDAMFFVWDGVATEASSGIPVSSDHILAITPYMSSWVTLSRDGRLMFFNGGGFQELAVFPFYNLGVTMGDSTNRMMLGDTLQVDGDKIYINIPNNFSANGDLQEVYIENNPSGIWCYDPKIGLYHRNSPSVSGLITATSSSVNPTTDIITISSSVVPDTGATVIHTSNPSDKIGGMTPLKEYYVIKVSSTEFKIATTKQNALDNQAVNITSAPSSTAMFSFLTVDDYGLSLCQNRTGAIGMTSQPTRLFDRLVFGGEYEDTTTSGLYAHSCMTVPFFENRGYVVTPKLESQVIDDVFQKIYVKYRPLKERDSIIVKYKDIDIVGLPVTTPQVPNTYICTWTSGTTFTTNANLSSAKTAFDNNKEIDCEIINGAGAGVISKITDISLSGSTYTVTLADTVDGASSGRYCNVIINNWTMVGTITSADTNGYKEFPVASNGKWIKVKCELRGYNTTIEEIQVINANHIRK